MNDFDTLISGWKNQPVPEPTKTSEIIRMAKGRIRESHRKHFATLIILGITFIIVASYAAITRGQNMMFFAGIGLMLASLIVRILIEWRSSQQLRKLNVGDFTQDYLAGLKGFYEKRRKIQGRITLTLFIAYVVGFLLLIPLFKQTMSSGLFIYVLVSGPVILCVLAFFVWKKIREELQNLEETIRLISEVLRSIE